MTFYNKIIPTRQIWVYPSEDMQRIEVNSTTDAEGEITLNIDNIVQVDSSSATIFLATAPLVPANQFTKTGINLNTGTQFTLENFILGSGRVKLVWNFHTSILGVNDGDFYFVSITVNSIVTVDFIVKIRNESI